MQVWCNTILDAKETIGQAIYKDKYRTEHIKGYERSRSKRTVTESIKRRQSTRNMAIVAYSDPENSTTNQLQHN